MFFLNCFLFNFSRVHQSGTKDHQKISRQCCPIRKLPYTECNPPYSCLPKEACAHGAYAVPLHLYDSAPTVTLKLDMTLQTLLALALPDGCYTHQSRSTTGWSQDAFASDHRLDSLVNRFCHRNTLAVRKLIKKMMRNLVVLPSRV